MYLIEPLLNRFFRNKMKSVLRFDSISSFWPPAITQPNADGYLLYIHIPFCESLCPYCSFHRYVYEEALAERYFSALWKELRMYCDLGYDFGGVYVGGGTPTIAIDKLTETLKIVRELFSVKEISVETNPNHLTEKHLSLLRQAGINRLSVGVQSFDDAILKRIGRLEKYGNGNDIRDKLSSVIGRFDTLNIDLIFNYPLQTEASLRRDLDIIDALLPEQVTFYPLMTAQSVEAELEKSLGSIDYRKEKDLYFLILERMKINYTGSTAWCFSRKASMIDEYIIAYEHYVGAGSGAFGYYNDRIYINTFSIEQYLQALDENRFPVSLVKKFSQGEHRRYFFLMKLFGLSMSRQAFRDKFGGGCESLLFFESMLLKISGAMNVTPDELVLTDRGRYYWVMAMREFFIAVDTMRDRCRSLTCSANEGPCAPH